MYASDSVNSGEIFLFKPYPVEAPSSTTKETRSGANTETKNISESVERQLNTAKTSGSSTTLIESKTYENPQFLRIKDLMNKL